MGAEQSNASGRLAALDGWRAISVGLVIFCHLAAVSGIAVRSSGNLAGRILRPFLAECGALGVHVFFVISGYVIVRGLIGEQARTGRISMSGFYARRAFRILPPLVLYVAAITGLVWLGLLPRRAMGAAAALTFTCNLHACGGWWGGHTWSLAYEEQFYIVVPAVFALTFRSSGARAVVGLLGLLCLLPLLTIPLGAGVSEFVGPFIAIGMGVAWACAESLVTPLCRRIPTLAIAPAAALLLVVERLEYTRLLPLAIVLSPLVIVYLLVATTQISPTTAGWLAGRTISYLGRISYGIYLWQQMATGPYPGAGPLVYLLSVPACIAWAGISFHWIERPLIGVGRSVSTRLADAAISRLRLRESADPSPT